MWSSLRNHNAGRGCNIRKGPIGSGGLLLGSESLSANFTKSSASSVLFDGAASLESISVQVSAAAGFLVGVMDASTVFTQTTVPTFCFGHFCKCDKFYTRCSFRCSSGWFCINFV